MKRIAPALFTIILVAGVAAIGSVAGRAIWENVTAEDDQYAKPPPLDVLNEEASKPRFAGEILGVFIGPPGTAPPAGFPKYEDICGDRLTEQVPWEQAGELALDLTLPKPFELDPDSLNTGVIACGDTVYAARWDYAAPQTDGYPGRMVIDRSVFRDATFDVSEDRVRTAEVEGVEVVIVEPLSENGVGSTAGAVIPADDNTIVIQSEGVPRDDLGRRPGG